MCMACWEEAGAPKLLNDNVLEAVRQLKVADDHDCAYSVGHIVFSDDNFEDEHIDFCLALPPELEEDGSIALRDPVAREILEFLKTISYEERLSANALQQGWWKP